MANESESTNLPVENDESVQNEKNRLARLKKRSDEDGWHRKNAERNEERYLVEQALQDKGPQR